MFHLEKRSLEFLRLGLASGTICRSTFLFSRFAKATTTFSQAYDLFIILVGALLLSRVTQMDRHDVLRVFLLTAVLAF